MVEHAADSGGLTGGVFGGGFPAGGPVAGGLGHVPGVAGYYLYRALAGVWEDDPVAWVVDGEETVLIEGQGLAPVASDPDCKLYLSFNGADGGVEVSDHSASGHDVTAGGAFALDDGEVKFGPTSGEFTTNSDELTIGDHPDFDFASGEFTIEMWFRWTGAPTEPYCLYRQWDDANNYVDMRYEELLPLKRLTFDFSNGGAGPSSPIGNAVQVDVDLDTWHHVAVTKDGSNVIRLYLDGVLVDDDTVATALPDLAADVVVNCGGDIRGWLDDLVVVNGSALYVAGSFDVPDRSYGHDDVNRWGFRRRGVSPGGQMGDYSIVTDVVVDAAGAVHFAVGNEPQSLQAFNVWNGPGEIDLRWVYDSSNQPAVPTGFNIYIDNAGEWDYVASVDYHAGGTPNYRWRSGAHAHGLEVTYKVVTYRTVSEVDYETDGPVVTITADAEGPPAVTELDVTIIDED